MLHSSRAQCMLVWALGLGACVGADYALPRRPVAAIGLQVLFSAVALTLIYRIEGRRQFWGQTAPFVAIVLAYSLFPRWFANSGRLLVWIAGGALASVVLGALIYVIWHAPPLPPVPPRRPPGPRIKTTRVRAPDLAGVVEYDTMHFTTIRVEECSSDWTRQLSQVRTDESGDFALPRSSNGPLRYVRVSWPGTRTVYLEVELSAAAPPLIVRLKPL